MLSVMPTPKVTKYERFARLMQTASESMHILDKNRHVTFVTL